MTASGSTPPPHLIAHDEHWVVCHAHSSGMLGWLILAPRRPVMEPSELTEEEATGLGRWQVRLARALEAELPTEKTYVVRFGEAPGHRLHFHIVARPPDLDPELRGSGIFAFLQPGQAERVEPEQRDDLARRLAGRLRTTPGRGASTRTR